MKLNKLEENLKEWIWKHKFLWLTFLSAIGIFLGSLFIYIVGGTVFQAVVLSIIYATIFIIVDVTTWGGK